MNSVLARNAATEDVRITEIRISLSVEAINLIARKPGIGLFIPKASMVVVHSQLLDRP